MRTIIESQRRVRTWQTEYRFWDKASHIFWGIMAVLALVMLAVEIYKAV